MYHAQLEYYKNEPWFSQLIHNILHYPFESPSNVISLVDSFTWDKTPEGYQFWAEINESIEDLPGDLYAIVRELYPSDQFPEYYI